MLTFENLATKLPAGTFTETADDVTLSLKTLMGLTSVQLADTQVVNAAHDFLTGCANAQTDYNSGNSPAMNTFNSPTYSGAVLRPDGERWTNATFTVVTSSPVDFSRTQANMA